MNTNIFIAKSLWKRNPEKGGLSGGSSIIAGVSVGISIMIMILAVVISDGFKKEIKDKAVGFSGEILLHSPGVDITTDIYPVSATPSFLDSIINLEDVASVNPYAYRSAILKREDAIQGVMLKGVDYSFDYSFFERALVEGTLPNINDSLTLPQILISKRLKEMLGYSVGEEIIIYFIDESVRVRKFYLSGIYDVQLEDLDQSILLTSLEVVQGVNRWRDNEVSGLEVRLSSSANIGKVANEIEGFTERAPSNESYYVTQVDDLFPHLFDWLKLLDFNVLIIMLLMLLVAGFNMVSGLLILLFEKTSMIGILKALGMRDTSIHKIFLIRAMMLVVVGMVVGNILGVILALLQQRYKIISLDPVNYFVDHVPIYFNWFKVFALNIGSLLLIVVMLMIPSFFISRVSPEKTLRVK